MSRASVSHEPERRALPAVAIVRSAWVAVASLVLTAFVGGLGWSFPAEPPVGSPAGARAALLFLSANAAAFALLSRVALPTRLRHVLVALAHGIALRFLLHGPESAGDSEKWRAFAAGDEVWLSEAGAHLVYSFGHAAGVIDLLAPAFGASTVWVLLRMAAALARAIGVEAERIAAALFALYLASPVPFLFAFAYVETPQLSLPFLLLGILGLARYAEGERSIVAGSAWLGAACFVHGMNCALVPLVGVAVWIRGAILRDLIRGALALAVPIAVGCLAARVLGFAVLPGNVDGGGDDVLFVPLATLVSKQHLVLFANVAVLGLPVLPVVGLAMVRRASGAALKRSRSLVLLCCASLGYLGYASTIGFDYGYPRDADLMVAMSIVHAPTLACLVYAASGRKAVLVLALLVVANAAYSWTELARRFPLASAAPAGATATWSDGIHRAPHRPHDVHRRRVLRHVEELLAEHPLAEDVEALLRADPSLSVQELELAVRRVRRRAERGLDEAAADR